uniref:Uncharacterized protein n=1 Tax=Rhipicephalus zambeziensis TaxID=60191 RepID=A0A224Y9U6_9ACAR
MSQQTHTLVTSKHAHTMQKHILQQSCNNLILLLWTYEKEVYVFVWDGDEDDIHFFFLFQQCPRLGRRDSSQRGETMYTLAYLLGRARHTESFLSRGHTFRASRLSLRCPDK